MYTKHFFLLIVIICSLIINVYSQKHVTPKNEQQFVFTCKKIAQALVNKDLQTLNAYINKNIGVDVMYGYGAYGGRLHLNKLISDTSLFFSRRLL